MGHWAGRRQGRRRASIILSHTCSLWRTIALHHPALWSYINLWQTSQPLTKLFAERCEDLPLKITGWDSDKEYVSGDVSFYALTELLDRTTDLSVLASDQVTWFFDEPVDFEPFGSRTLFPTISLCGRLWRKQRAAGQSSLQGSLRRGRPTQPSSSIPCWIPLSLRYAGLRSLRIDGVPLAATSRKDKDFSWVIRESPLLEHIELGSWGKGEGETPRPRQLRALNPNHAGQIL